MAQQDADRKPGGARRGALIAGVAVLLLFVAGGFVSSVGAGLGILGLIVLIAGAWAIVRGHASWVRLATRKAGLVAAVAGLAAFVVGASVTPSTPTRATSASDAASTSSATRSSTSAVSTTPAAPAVVNYAAPVTTAVATTSPAPVLPPTPTMTMTCPTGGSQASALFGKSISATAPYTVDIDYGDGDRYTNDDQHLSAVFSHTYQVSGNFVVSALLTDAAGQTASASCVYGWTKPVPAPVHTSVSSGVGSSSGSSSTGGRSSSVNRSSSGSSSGGPSDGDTYTNVDGNQVHVPVQAPSAPSGATAHCRDGSWSFSQHRSGTCSHHGGVARWLG